MAATIGRDLREIRAVRADSLDARVAKHPITADQADAKERTAQWLGKS